MTWKAFVSAVGQVTIGLILGGMICFVLLNVVVGCESWNNPNCVTATEFVSLFFGG